MLGHRLDQAANTLQYLISIATKARNAATWPRLAIELFLRISEPTMVGMAGCVLVPEIKSLSSWISGEARTTRPVHGAGLSLGYSADRHKSGLRYLKWLT